jgi:hypothetical protein
MSGHQNQRFNYMMSSKHYIKYFAHPSIFENELFPTMAVQLMQHLDAIGIRNILAD